VMLNMARATATLINIMKLLHQKNTMMDTLQTIIMPVAAVRLSSYPGELFYLIIVANENIY